MTSSTHGADACWVSATSLAACEAPAVAKAGKPNPTQLFSRLETQSQTLSDPGNSCKQQLFLSFFFDGTGNNKEIDDPKNKSSNIARLFDSHRNDQALGILKEYIPGVGTPFPRVGDDGGGLGLALASGGERRLIHAMERFDFHLGKAEARAHNPANKIAGIHVAIFGFSRGAALARAFALRLHKRPERTGSGWAMKGKGYPFRLYFMGLFDTVASVGLSNTLRNPEKSRFIHSAGNAAVPIVGALAADSVLVQSEAAKGHNAWGSELRIPPSCERCIHYTAAHEVRESFPLDSVRVAGGASSRSQAVYPAGCTEVVYPGMHSDVGGGYAPGEQGRTATLNDQLSQIPLRHMQEEARDAGVPLLSIAQLPDKVEPLFHLSPELIRLYDSYMSKTQPSGCLESQNASHLYAYYRWRKLRVTSPAQNPQLNSLDNERDRSLAARKEHTRKADALSRRPQILGAQAHHAATPFNTSAQTINTSGSSIAEVRQAAAAQRYDARERQQNIHAERAQAAAYDANAQEADKIAKQIREEDQRFIEDCKDVAARAHAGEKLTLHEATLLRAWQAPLLDDPAIIDFFDRHVHDSVAGFRAGGAGYIDNSRLARPRDVFQGAGPSLA